MAFEQLLVSLVSKLDESGFKALDRMEAKAEKRTQILGNTLRNMFVGIIGTIGVKEIVDASVKLDTLNKSFAALAGGDAAGAAQLEYIRKEANRLGQVFETTADSYKNLFAAGVGANMKLEEIQSIFSSVLEAGTVLGSSEQQVQSALMALEQMISKGKVSAEELRRQLGNALHGTMPRAVRAMGTTTAGLEQMMKKGLDAQKFVKAFANELHNEFGDKAVEASHSLRGELNRLHNEIFKLKTSFFDGDAGKSFAEVLRQLNNTLGNPEFQKSLNNIGDFLAKSLKFLMEHKELIKDILIILAAGKVFRFLLRAGKGIADITVKTLKFTSVLSRAIGRFGGAKVALMVLRKYGVALIPVFGEIASSIFLIIDVLKILFGMLNKNTMNARSKDPHWVKLSDDRYVDTNPYSKYYGQFGRGFSENELVNEYGNFNKHFDFGTQKNNSVMFSSPVYAPPKTEATPWGQKVITSNDRTSSINIQNGAIQINTRTDNPQEIGEAVRTAMLNIFDNFNLNQGYETTTA